MSTPAPERAQAPELPRHLYLGPPVPDSTRNDAEVRDIGARSEADRRGGRGPVWIGRVIYRDELDGQPAPWEVHRFGGTTYGWYSTEGEALDAAAEYAAAYLTLRGTGHPVHLHDVHPPVTDRPSGDLVDALAAERRTAGERIRRILDECATETTLRTELTRYAARLRGGGATS